MKKLLFLSVLIIHSSVLLFNSASAQAPSGFTYQSVLRDANNDLIINTAVGTQISILQTTAGGTAVYVETHTASTNANGLLTLQVGAGSAQSGTFASIDWSAGPYFIKSETDPAGGTTYTITGTQQMMSVPYALHAKTAENGVYTAGTGIDITNNVVSTTSTCGLSIGDTYQGGIIFYLDATGCHGLIAAPSDQSTGIQWYNGSYIDTRAYGSGLFEGKYNTEMINFSQGGATSAAAICGNLSLGGYNDWYLPSIEELNKMYQNIGQGNALGLGNVGGFATNYYWSSTEVGSDGAWIQGFGNGVQGYYAKFNTYYVRAVRAF